MLVHFIRADGRYVSINVADVVLLEETDKEVTICFRGGRTIKLAATDRDNFTQDIDFVTEKINHALGVKNGQGY